MPLVTGDRYLESLVKFVDKLAGNLIDGTVTLKLNPVGLHYVQSRLEALSELESLLHGAPVDYLRAYISDLGDHRALEQLRRILRLLTSLKVVSVLPPNIRDPTRLSLLPFERLKVLELRGCDLTTSAARGLLELRHTLEKFVCHNSTDALRHVFASRIAEIKDSPQWNRLNSVSCACNGLLLMDESLQLLPVVETLDLSRNKFTRVDNLRKCINLKHLDLGFNHLRTIASLNELSCRVVKLVLRNNALTTLRGIENLLSLEGLDLSYNILSNFSELEILSGLTHLKSLWLEGNPLCCARWYRAQVFSFFPGPYEMQLDDKRMSREEFWKRQIIIARRHSRPASFGFYFKAKDNAGLEVPINTKPKKISRLANIESEEQSPSVCSDLESVECENEIPGKVDNSLDEKDEIVDLINRIELMKRERSSLWLEELKEWINHDPKSSIDGAQYSGNVVDPDQINCPESNSRYQQLGKSSKYVADSAHVSSIDSSVYALECDPGFSGRQYYDPISDVSTTLSMRHVDVEGIPFVEGSNSSPRHMLSPCTGGAQPVSCVVQENDGVTMKRTVRPLAAIDEIMESQSSTACLSSPPHYQEDILHRRQNLEEELFQISAESYSTASTDSNTSDSDDDSAEFCTPQVDASFIDEPLDKSVDEFDFTVSYSGEPSYKKRYDVPKPTHNGNHLLDSDARQISGITEDKEPYSSELLQDMFCNVQQEGDCRKNKNCKRISRRRVVSLVDRDAADDEGVPLPETLDASRVDVVDITKRLISLDSDIHTCENAGLTSHSEPSGNILSETKSGYLGSDDFIVNHFNSNVADSLVQETCRQYVRCSSFIGTNGDCKECELVVLRSSEQKLYMLLISNEYDGSETTLSLIGCHKIEDVKEVLVGLGLHIVRSLEKSRQLFCILDILDPYNTKDGLILRSLEQVQVDLISRNFLGGSNTSIFQFSMVLHWRCTFTEDSWLSRSLFVLERHLLLCIEDFLQFGSLTEISPCSSYFSFDSCCSIVDVQELVIESSESLCLTLAVKKVMSKLCLDKTTNEVGTIHSPAVPLTWKLRWFSEESLFKFLSLFKALHDSVTSAPLVVVHKM
uniref:Serine/threonine-protein kinase 11-interacting protein n=1 Tax=Daucus carota subsp. sativus TaxID=79200 RepID=A0A166BTS3_DAUCS